MLKVHSGVARGPRLTCPLRGVFAAFRAVNANAGRKRLGIALQRENSPSADCGRSLCAKRQSYRTNEIGNLNVGSDDNTVTAARIVPLDYTLFVRKLYRTLPVGFDQCSTTGGTPATLQRAHNRTFVKHPIWKSITVSRNCIMRNAAASAFSTGTKIISPIYTPGSVITHSHENVYNPVPCTSVLVSKLDFSTVTLMTIESDWRDGSDRLKRNP